jgi:hypothetical protein
MEGKLHKYFLNNSGKNLHKWIHYFDIYEKHFNYYANKPIVMFEIGVFEGGSLDMWKDYFGPDSIIVGIDINPDCVKNNDPDRGVFVEIGNQSDVNFLQSVIDKYGRPDIVLDDGSHIMHDLINTFNYLYYQTKENGVYLVEDLHTCYWTDFGGGLRNPNSFMEFTKNKIDELNANYTRGELEISDFTKQTQSISIYDSIVAFERRPQQKKFHIQTGNVNSLNNLIIGD